MSRITNTEKDINPLLYLTLGEGAIEIEEKQGQSQLVASCQLPGKRSDYSKTHDAIEPMERLGIKVLGTSKNDDLFVDVVLPDGWTKKRTDHSMWSELVDDQGRKRASIFYKAAFYDRSAFIGFERRFYLITYHSTWEIEERKGDDDYSKYNRTPHYAVVKDCGKEVFRSETIFWTKKYKKSDHESWWKGWGEAENTVKQQAEKWLNENYPEWGDTFAYWQ